MAFKKFPLQFLSVQLKDICGQIRQQVCIIAISQYRQRLQHFKVDHMLLKALTSQLKILFHLIILLLSLLQPIFMFFHHLLHLVNYLINFLVAPDNLFASLHHGIFKLPSIRIHNCNIVLINK